MTLVIWRRSYALSTHPVCSIGLVVLYCSVCCLLFYLWYFVLLVLYQYVCAILLCFSSVCDKLIYLRFIVLFVLYWSVCSILFGLLSAVKRMLYFLFMLLHSLCTLLFCLCYFDLLVIYCSFRIILFLLDHIVHLHYVVWVVLFSMYYISGLC